MDTLTKETQEAKMSQKHWKYSSKAIKGLFKIQKQILIY